MSRRIGLVTCLGLPEPDPDAALLLDAVRARGVDAEWVAWDDPSADWASWHRLVVRSTWNYLHHHDAFLAWIDRASAATRLDNPGAILKWNAHKQYLLELKARGLPVVPTELVRRGGSLDLASLIERRGWTRAVVKPAVSAGSFGTERFDASSVERAQAAVDRMLPERDLMVQPYVASVEDYGERSLIFIDGELTHAIRKSPRFSGDRESVTGPLPVAADEREVAGRVISAIGPSLLYARVDLARDEAGAPMLMELELIEPSLFLRQSPGALARLAEAIASS